MKVSSKKLLFYLLFAHIILWTSIPAIFNTNLPLDTIEALAWGNELSLGYDKYPPVFPLFTELFFKLFGNQDWSYYLLSQLFVASSFFIIFQFSKYFFDNDFHSLLSVLLLESIYFFNYTTPELNAFIPLFPLLATTVLFCWRAIKFDKNFDWIIFGVFAGISTLTYYLALYLIASLTIFFMGEILIKKKINKKYFLALVAYIIILSPHLYYIFDNNFKSIEYAFFRSFSDPLSDLGETKILNHIFHPLFFLAKQIFILIPFLFFVRIIISSFKVKINLKDKKLIFLLTIFLLPIILMFLTSIIGGVRIRTMWMTTFYMFPGVFFIYLFNSKIVFKKFKRFFVLFLFVFFVLPISYGVDSYIQKDKRTDFPGKEIAFKIQSNWDKNFSNNILIVAGESWVYGGWYAGNLSYNLRDRPKLRYVIEKDIDYNIGTVWIDVLNSIKSCNGILLRIEPYFDSCLVGRK